MNAVLKRSVSTGLALTSLLLAGSAFGDQDIEVSQNLSTTQRRPKVE